MTIVSSVVVFVMIWTVVLFMVLPFFKPTPPKNVPVGHATGAPSNPRLKLKFIVTTVISLVLVVVYWMIVKYDLITLRPDI